MKKTIRLFTTLMVCMAMALCVSCKKDDDKSDSGGGNTGGGNTDIGGTIAGHAYVDLGLPSGLLWATCNVGADSPEDYGNYYAWGETEPKSTNWDYYKWWYNGDWGNLAKYNTQSDHGTVDNKTVLDPEDDAAHVNWGGAWRMPTSDEMEELVENCTWTTQSGNNGYRVIGPNSNSIFLPVAGCFDAGCLNDAGHYGYYWSSSLYTVNPYDAYYLLFGHGSVGRNNYHRYSGHSVRPVCSPQK